MGGIKQLAKNCKIGQHLLKLTQKNKHIKYSNSSNNLQLLKKLNEMLLVYYPKDLAFEITKYCINIKGFKLVVPTDVYYTNLRAFQEGMRYLRYTS